MDYYHNHHYYGKKRYITMNGRERERKKKMTKKFEKKSVSWSRLWLNWKIFISFVKKASLNMIIITIALLFVSWWNIIIDYHMNSVVQLNVERKKLYQFHFIMFSTSVIGFQNPWCQCVIRHLSSFIDGNKIFHYFV